MDTEGVKKLIAEFTEQDMEDAVGIVLLWGNKKGELMLRTNLPEVTCWDLFEMALKAADRSGK